MRTLTLPVPGFSRGLLFLSPFYADIGWFGENDCWRLSQTSMVLLCPAIAAKIPSSAACWEFFSVHELLACLTAPCQSCVCKAAFPSSSSRWALRRIFRRSSKSVSQRGQGAEDSMGLSFLQAGHVRLSFISLLNRIRDQRERRCVAGALPNLVG